jgi:hypothetical protein
MMMSREKNQIKKHTKINDTKTITKCIYAAFCGDIIAAVKKDLIQSEISDKFILQR